MLHESIFNTWWVTRVKMCVLEGLNWLKMSHDIKDRLFLESVAFVYNRIQEHSLSVRDISPEFYN